MRGRDFFTLRGGPGSGDRAPVTVHSIEFTRSPVGRGRARLYRLVSHSRIRPRDELARAAAERESRFEDATNFSNNLFVKTGIHDTLVGSSEKRARLVERLTARGERGENFLFGIDVTP